MARIAGCKIKCVVVLMLLVMAFGSGCRSSHPMALDNNTSKLDLTKKSIAIMSIKVSNEYVPSYQPFGHTLSISSPKNKNPGDCAYFRLKTEFAREKDKYNEYMISIDMPPGKYLINELFSQSEFKIPMLAQGSTLMPLYLPFELKPNEIAYLGRIEGTIRKRQNDNEIRAGAIFPLLDQAGSGYPDGTYDIIIVDNYDADIQHFIQEYPFLKNYAVNKSLLSPWKQPSRDELIFPVLGGR